MQYTASSLQTHIKVVKENVEQEVFAAEESITNDQVNSETPLETHETSTIEQKTEIGHEITS